MIKKKLYGLHPIRATIFKNSDSPIYTDCLNRCMLATPLALTTRPAGTANRHQAMALINAQWASK